MLTAREIIDLNYICEILRPIEMATREIYGEKYVTSSKVIPLTRLLNTKISTLTPKQNMAENLKINVPAEINKRLLPTEYVNTLAVAILLDPRFNPPMFAFIDEASYYQVKREVAADEDNAISSATIADWYNYCRQTIVV